MKKCEMFCYQCEQTAGGKGCTKLGVCGKTPEIANLQDLLIFQIKGISCYAKTFIEQEQHVDKSIVTFIENALFTTLTNVNFDADAHVKLLRQSQEIKETLKSSVGEINNPTYHATYKLPNDKNEMLKDAYIAGIMYDSSLLYTVLKVSVHTDIRHASSDFTAMKLTIFILQLLKP